MPFHSGELGATRTPGQAAYAVHISRKAMACEFEVVLNAGQYAGDTSRADALDLVEQLERQLSYFRRRAKSARSITGPSKSPSGSEPRLFALLTTAQAIYRESGGAFDLTATPLWKAWGFAKRRGRVPGDEEVREAMKTVGGSLIDLSPWPMERCDC